MKPTPKTNDGPSIARPLNISAGLVNLWAELDMLEKEMDALCERLGPVMDDLDEPPPKVAGQVGPVERCEMMARILATQERVRSTWKRVTDCIARLRV